MDKPALFTWRPFTGELIVCGVRWSLRYALSTRDVEALLRERGGAVDHTTVFRCVQRYAPALDQRCRPHLTATNDSYRVDETYIRNTKQWYYLSRAVESTGAPLDFMRSATRNADAAERFFRTALGASHTTAPRVITTDKNAADPPAIAALQRDGTLAETCTVRRGKYLQNVGEQDHRLVQRRVTPGLGCGAFRTAQRTRRGDEAMHRMRKGPLEGIAKGAVLAQNRVMAQVFGVVA